ncbi:hypothetical protein [Methanolobus sp. WCC5]|uniref:hypothetical protein n=1 Tax=Methanolobus sp. WCC5 TaxID=3125785 RepID=UPI00324DF4D8
MKAKILMILMIILSFSAIGCVDGTDGDVNETETPDGEIDGAEEGTDSGDIDTEEPVDESTDETDQGAAEEENGRLEVVESEAPRTYTIYMRNYLTQPGNITINTGDTVVWFNDNDPTRVFTLVSNEGLWEDTNIGRRLSFRYTFDEPGTYTYKVLGYEERMKGTIIVK